MTEPNDWNEDAELARKPTLITRPMRGAMYAAAAALLVLAGLAVFVVLFARAPNATASVQGASVQASNRVITSP